MSIGRWVCLTVCNFVTLFATFNRQFLHLFAPALFYDCKVQEVKLTENEKKEEEEEEEEEEEKEEEEEEEEKEDRSSSGVPATTLGAFSRVRPLNRVECPTWAFHTRTKIVKKKIIIIKEKSENQNKNDVRENAFDSFLFVFVFFGDDNI